MPRRFNVASAFKTHLKAIEALAFSTAPQESGIGSATLKSTNVTVRFGVRFHSNLNGEGLSFPHLPRGKALTMY